MLEHPLVSVTVCVRDGGHWVDDCLDSLLQQTHRPLEIIAVNDGSSDDTKSKLDAWHEKYAGGEVPIHIIHQDSLGLSAGRMAAVNSQLGHGLQLLISMFDLNLIGLNKC